MSDCVMSGQHKKRPHPQKARVGYPKRKSTVKSDCATAFSFFRFQIFLFGVHGPNIVFVYCSIANVIDGGHGGEHGMVHIVVFVHAVAADQRTDCRYHARYLRIISKLLVCCRNKRDRSFGPCEPQEESSADFPRGQSPHSDELFDGEIGHSLIRDFCQRTSALLTEISTAEPNLQKEEDQPRERDSSC